MCVCAQGAHTHTPHSHMLQQGAMHVFFFFSIIIIISTPYGAHLLYIICTTYYYVAACICWCCIEMQCNMQQLAWCVHARLSGLNKKKNKTHTDTLRRVCAETCLFFSCCHFLHPPLSSTYHIRTCTSASFLRLLPACLHSQHPFPLLPT